MPKGFGSLTPERRREISSAGGKAAHAAGTAHRFSSQEAKAAGRIGGLKARKRQLALDALATPPVTYADCPATEPPPPAAPTEPAPAPADPQAALDAAEIQHVYDEATARS